MSARRTRHAATRHAGRSDRHQGRLGPATPSMDLPAVTTAIVRMLAIPCRHRPGWTHATRGVGAPAARATTRAGTCWPRGPCPYTESPAPGHPGGARREWPEPAMAARHKMAQLSDVGLTARLYNWSSAVVTRFDDGWVGCERVEWPMVGSVAWRTGSAAVYRG
jgi:hypothetical protein